jgi:cytochrome c oxidase subunit 3
MSDNHHEGHGHIKLQYQPALPLNNGKLFLWLFLSTEIMFFAGLIGTYIVLRFGAPPGSWPHPEDVHLAEWIGAFNTFVLLCSSVTIVLALESAKHNQAAVAKGWLLATFLLGSVFLGVKAFEYKAKFEHGLLPRESTFLAIYFTMTGLHGLHVIGGMIVNGYLWGPGSKMWATEPQRFTNRIEVAGLYWHFVDLVWIFLFPTLYLLPGK